MTPSVIPLFSVRLDVDEKISDRLSMIFLTCRTADKISAFLYLVRLAIANNEMTIVFCATMKHVEYLAAVAQRAAIDCVVLYSQLDAAARKINIERLALGLRLEILIFSSLIVLSSLFLLTTIDHCWNISYYR